MTMRLIIIGAGGFGQTVADLARQSGEYEGVYFLDDMKTGETVLGKCGDFARFHDGNTCMIAALGNNPVRLDWVHRFEQAGIPVATIIHPRAYISPTARVDAGTVVLPHAVVNTDCHVQKGCIINCGAMIDHGCMIEEGTHVCLGAIIKAENRIARLSKVEAGQVIENRTYPV